jgi:hypothetical protein
VTIVESISLTVSRSLMSCSFAREGHPDQIVSCPHDFVEG